MTTLSASALALLFGAARLGVENLDVPLGGSVFGLSLVEALLAMSIALLVEGRPGAELSRVQLGFSTTLFLIGLLFVVVLPSFAAQL
jgi:hypothetical protein